MVSEKPQVGRPHEGESSKAGTRGGLTRSSWEGTVMVVEPRSQPGAGSPASTRKEECGEKAEGICDKSAGSSVGLEASGSKGR